ncbi:MAG: amino acid adenylation domain-containing protein [Ruminococcaceae bacterium]|nr:amino acid adenylation domain-containing protein [Oscillospiraceae bacterium]
MNLTKPQKLIYEMEKFHGGAISVVAGSMLIDGKADSVKISNAVNQLLKNNEVLRTRILENDNNATQEVVAFKEQEFEILEFQTEDEFKNYAKTKAREPLDLTGSLCDIKIIVLPEKYGLFARLHHIISDAWTLSLMGTQFNKIMCGEAFEAFSYCDCIETEESYTNSKRYEKDKEFFIEQFKKCDEATFLNEKQTSTLNAERKTFVISKDKAEIIRVFAKNNNTSEFLLFLNALSSYINRTKLNTEKFYIGTAVLNRSNFKEKNTMGMFINTVPLLIELENEKSFKENLESVEKTVFSVFRHQKFNYGDVLKTLRQEFDFQEKLYDVMLSYQNATVEGESFETEWYHCGSQSESLQIHIDDRDNEGIFKIHYDYLTEKFTENEIERLNTHILNLLFDGIENENKKLYELNILSQAEKNTLLFEFNDTKVDYPKDKCVHELFEERVKEHPDKIALIACDKTLTYQELNEEANRIAHSLIEKGVKVGDIVAFALPRRSYLISTMLGILKAGAAYMPIDPDYPQDRIEYMANQDKVVAFINDENIKAFLSNEHTGNTQIKTSLENYFCVLHTSGSTGNPKGAIIFHKNMINFTFSNQYLLNNIDTVIAINTVTFDVFEMDTIFTLISSKLCVLASEEQQYNQASFETMMSLYKNCLFWATPTKMTNYINNSKTGEFVKNINCYVVGGEVLKPELLDRIRKLNSEIKIYTVYGPTETLIYSTLVDVSNTNDITIGHPIDNTQIYILDTYKNITPIGSTGELCIAGDGVGAGYLNRSELTAEKFIDNPFGEGKLYKTGDLVYWREDGNIAFVGRNDFQVKIRGLRIELGEIENALCSIEEISQAVVVVRKNNEGRQLICAFYTGKELEAKEIRSKIGKRLPKYMLPHIFTHLAEMPLTPSGKINRKPLPEVNLYNKEDVTKYIAPTTEKEKVLTEVTEDVLNIKKVGIADNFIDLGGDSLKSIELIAELEKQGYHTDTKTIFECDTIKDLAEKLTFAEETAEMFDFSGDIPATPAQMRVYTAQNMDSNSTTYNVPYIFKVDKVDKEKLQKAINGLIDRHEILRTHFENKDGNIIAVINDSAFCEVEELENDNITAFIRPFDLSKAPLLRVGIYKNTVMIDMHHIITDGGSMPVFFNELNELYMGRSIENSPFQYKEFAVQNHNYAESEKYWLSVFSDNVQNKTKTDFPPVKKRSFSGNVLYDTIDFNLHLKIQNKCKELNITPFVFYMSAFYVLLSKFNDCEDVTIGIPVSGRNTQNLNAIGMFVNTIALRNKPIPTKEIASFLSEVKESTINSIEHQNYPFGNLVKALNLPTNKNNPLFDIMFAYQSNESTEFLFADKPVTLLPVPITTSKYNFTFTIMPQSKKVNISVEYSTQLYRENTISELLANYKVILRELLKTSNKIADTNINSNTSFTQSALPEIDLENIANDTEFVAPETQMQKELCKLFEIVLSTSPVGIEDDFFDLGGDSLKAIELVSKAHTEGIYFALQNVFDYPTVRELCEFIENGDKQIISFNDIDFTKINKILDKNKVEYISKPEKSNVGNIILAGATGYLGIHILADFLDNDNGTAYCLVRRNNEEDSSNRLQDLLVFYFGNKYECCDRIKVICADLQKDKFGLQETEYNNLLKNVDTVINCAASVKHYGSYKYFYEANVETTKKLIEFCKLSNAKLIHTSTLSVSGNSFGDDFDGVVSENELHFYENTLYIGQPLENVYARSKFEAEKAVLDAMADGLQANIMRMGNLTNRLSDGKFQKNYESNAFLQRVKSVLELGIFPDYLMNLYAEFTPIDEAANAVMKITRHFNTEQNVFHINSIKVLYFDKLLKIFNNLGFTMETVEGETFTNALKATAKQTGLEHIFETFINDMDENDQLNYDSNIRIENDFTVEYLKSLGFEWSEIDFEYMRKYVEYFKNIGYME